MLRIQFTAVNIDILDTQEGQATNCQPKLTLVRNEVIQDETLHSSSWKAKEANCVSVDIHATLGCGRLCSHDTCAPVHTEMWTSSPVRTNQVLLCKGRTLLSTLTPRAFILLVDYSLVEFVIPRVTILSEASQKTVCSPGVTKDSEFTHTVTQSDYIEEKTRKKMGHYDSYCRIC